MRLAAFTLLAVLARGARPGRAGYRLAAERPFQADHPLSAPRKNNSPATKEHAVR